MEATDIGALIGVISFAIHAIQGTFQLVKRCNCKSKCFDHTLDICIDSSPKSPLLTSPLISKIKNKTILENGSVPGSQGESSGFSQGKQES